MNEWNMKVAAPMNRVWKHGNYLEGSVFTQHGIVYVYSQGGVFNGVTDSPHTTLQIVVRGRLYSRDIHRRYTLRGLATIANRFARDLLLRRDEQKKGGSK